ncbi:MAG: roadblock/LC7 domain-containing protein [Actinomycetota bacterium]|nr:roadblock/LC7 domain-containing protein [Actinomycetota bacterium]
MSDRYAAVTDQVDHRSARLERVLTTLLGQAPELEAAAVVSFDGLPMAAALPPGMDEDRVAAMSAALLSLGERAAEGLGRGDLSQVYVEGESGTVFLISADDEAVLVAVGARGAKVGLLLFEVRHAAAAVGETLRREPDVAPMYDEEPAVELAVNPEPAPEPEAEYEPPAAYEPEAEYEPPADEDEPPPADEDEPLPADEGFDAYEETSGWDDGYAGFGAMRQPARTAQPTTWS